MGARETQPAGDEDTRKVPAQRVVCEGLLQRVQGQEETRELLQCMQQQTCTHA